ncbi:MAG TPA: TIM-barrel domain-containing protein [Acidobacteriaceae bacterium]
MTFFDLRASCVGAPLTLAFILFVAAPGQTVAQANPSQPPVIATKSQRGFDATIGPETLHVVVCSESIVHIITRPHGGDAAHPQPWLLPAAQSCPGTEFTFVQDAKQATLSTAKLKVVLSLTRGDLSYAAVAGRPLLRESGAEPRSYTPVTLNGESTYHIIDRFALNGSEAIYGLGQHQSGMFNYRGSTVELAQNNTDIAIPFLTSTNGFGILWNTASFTYADNRFPPLLQFDTMAGDGVDYFLIYGPEMDDIIHGYRVLTGHSPMLPRWAYGFIQSKDRYTSLDEISSIAQQYRREHIPMDVMVQDWFWWKHKGDPVFNNNYHDVPEALKKLHGEHVHTMISTWAMFDTDSDTYKKMDAENLLVPRAHVYDATNQRARDVYWESLPGKLFAEGWDSFWLDSAEPEEYWPHVGDAILRDRNIALGNGAIYTNIYPLMHNEGIQQHWRATTDRKRVFLLTRSAFAGQQRVGGTVWSGDVYSSFWALSRQVPAGLNYALSGMPYWTTDIGGYFPLYDGQSSDPAYQELYLRWFEFGVFCPIFRTHGHRPHNELWSYPSIEPSLIEYDKLRYRMMPYIYSLAWRVSSDDYTIERPLVMDFRADPATWNIGDQFMFGPALMVNPVTEAKSTARRVYLPKNAQWYDFWTGAKTEGGQFLQAAAPLNRIPLYVRAGSILPLGPEEEYADEKVNAPIDLRIFPGADGTFTLYQDEGENYDYEKGKSSTIALAWTDAGRTLTLGARQGSYPGMPSQLEFRIVLVRPGHGVGEPEASNPDKVFTYNGSAMKISLR